MKVDILKVCINILKRWYVILLAIIIGGSIGYSLPNKEENEYTYNSQIFISLESNMISGSSLSSDLAYSENLNNFISNSVVALRSTGYHKMLATEVGLADLNHLIITIENLSKNIISIQVSYHDQELAKKVCELLTKTASTQINYVLQDNIDLTTGNFKEGTLDKDKIVVREILKPMLNMDDVEDKNNNVKITNLITYASIFCVVAIIILLCVELANPKVKSLHELKIRYGEIAPINKAISFTQGMNMELASLSANQLWEDKKVAIVGTKGIVSNLFASKDFDGKKILIISNDMTSNGIEEKTKTFDYLGIGDNAIKSISEIKETIEKSSLKYDFIFFLLEVDQPNANLQSVLRLADKVFLNVNLSKDKVVLLNDVIYTMQSNNIKISSIFANDK